MNCLSWAGPGNDQTSPSSKNTRMSKHHRSSGLVLTSYLAKFGFARLLRHIGQQLTSPNQRLKIHEDGGTMWSAWWKVEVYWFPTNVNSTKLTNYTCHSDMVPVLSTELVFLLHWGTHVNLDGCNKLRRTIESTLCWLKIIWGGSRSNSNQVQIPHMLNVSVKSYDTGGGGGRLRLSTISFRY